jgi:hypothetical protein
MEKKESAEQGQLPETSGDGEAYARSCSSDLLGQPDGSFAAFARL